MRSQPHRRFSFTALLAVVLLVLTLGLSACSFVGDDDADDEGSGSTQAPTAVVEQTSNELGAASTRASSQTDGDTDEDDDTSNQSDAGTEFASYADLVEAVNPAVVTVLNQQTFSGMFGGGTDGTDPQPVGSGTGFIISDDGYIITNNHVVEGSEEISVIYFDGTEVSAELVGSDPMTDLAVIQVEGDVPGVVELGDSEALRPGDRVIAIGSPLGDYTNTVTEGIVSGLDRRFPTESGAVIEDMIQHDAAINPGNSGGPLFNVDGEVVGVNTLVVRQSGSGVSAEGLGFAVPSNTVQLVSDDLIDDGEVERPYLGITYQLLTPRAAAALDLDIDHGALVTDLVPGPAQEAGVRIDDVITAINGDEINQQSSLQSLLFNYQPGDEVTLTIWRDGETLELNLTLAVRPSDL